ncbi:MAG: hypothetical protein IJO48_05855, partial [Clostridia bacterium]|nr:hypothetical protein [Clostridia bacterium]
HVNMLAGVSAYDPEDGDVSDSILVESISKFTEKGRCIVTYVAFDSNNHVVSATREMVYTDYSAPKFALLAPLKFEYDSSLNVTNYISVYDSIDGDISGRIKFSLVDAGDTLATVGKHPVQFTVSNSMGDVATLQTTVEIYSETYLDKLNTPQIHLNEYLIYIKANDIVNFGSYIKYVKMGDEMVTASSPRINELNIQVDRNDLNTRVPGVYSVTYSLDSENGYRGTADLVIIVEE